ncbi:hypothetical protein SprV_0501847700 [Sparganum proliferum]
MLMNAYHDEHPGIRTVYRTENRLLKSRLMHTPTRLSATTAHNLFFTDDGALHIVTEEDTQKSMELFAAGCLNFGLTISTDKTVVMHQPPANTECNVPRIPVYGI